MGGHLSRPDRASRGVAVVTGAVFYAGPSPSGHVVKLVHNAIEFGMIQAIAESVELLRGFDHDLGLPPLADGVAGAFTVEEGRQLTFALAHVPLNGAERHVPSRARRGMAGWHGTRPSKGHPWGTRGDHVRCRRATPPPRGGARSSFWARRQPASAGRQRRLDHSQLDVMGGSSMAPRVRDQLEPLDGRTRRLLGWMANEVAATWRSRMLATIRAIQRTLVCDGLMYRWDGDPRSSEHTGNFPQAFSHVGVINAAWRLQQTAPPQQHSAAAR